MRQIVLSTVAVALIAASASQALAAQSRPHARKDTAVSEQVRKALDAVNQPSRPGWQYSGWSAPAGR
jgi:archaellum component FlaG (FlaF/FlaG flagellin family)